MANAYYGKEVISEISDAQALPNAVSVDSTNMAYIGGQSGRGLAVSVYANTAISIATAQLFYIELQVWTADVAASAISPFKTAGAAEDNAHLWLLHKTSADGQLDFAAGDLICEYVIPNWFYEDGVKYDYVQLRYETDADESATEKVDAFLHAVI